MARSVAVAVAEKIYIDYLQARAWDAEARKHYDEETLPNQKLHGSFNFAAPPKSKAKAMFQGQAEGEGEAAEARRRSALRVLQRAARRQLPRQAASAT